MDASSAQNPVVNENADSSQEDLDTLLDRINVLSSGGSSVAGGGSEGGLAPEKVKEN